LALLGTFVVIKSSPVSGNRHEVLARSVEKNLVPEPRNARNQFGPDDAPVTIVEYADLCCPQCRKAFPKIHEIVTKYPGKVRVIYRYFPIYMLPGHEMSLAAIMAAELAGQKGKFWEFAEAFSAPEEAPKTRDGLDAIAKQFGVTTADIDKALADENGPAQQHLARDYSDAFSTFNINSTPTFIMTGKGLTIQKFDRLLSLMDELDKPEYQKLLKQ
jgi:protein-disulfide isomerase